MYIPACIAIVVDTHHQGGHLLYLNDSGLMIDGANDAQQIWKVLRGSRPSQADSGCRFHVKRSRVERHGLCPWLPIYAIANRPSYPMGGGSINSS